MSASVTLVNAEGERFRYVVRGGAEFAVPSGPPSSRRAYAAAHVVADPLAEQLPGATAHLDWEATLAYRRHLWDCGMAVAEAMDTAQRGMGLDWEAAKELIARSSSEAKAARGVIACGAGTDQLAPGDDVTLEDVANAYQEQCEFIEGHGSRVIVMASRALARAARGPEDYAEVYSRVFAQVREPVILHWLGEAFDPALAGYWGSREVEQAMDHCLAIIAEHAGQVDGIKISLLDAEHERAMRSRLPEGVRMYTGDDFNYPELILGDDTGYSDALLGIFDAIAPAAGAALAALDNGDTERYRRILEPTVPLARHIFSKPTYYYKTGITVLAFLNGHQEHFRMVGGQESARSAPHLATLLVLADEAGLVRDAELAASRMRCLMELAGVRQ